MKDTQLVFVVGSGRCGTKMIKKLLAGVPHIEARHEYVRNYYQRDAMLYYLGYLPYADMYKILGGIYEPAAYYSEAKIFLDSSHKLSWVADVLAERFPKAKFIHLVRDGRKVVSSFFHKLNIFDEHASQVQRDWIEGKETIMPPLTENFWHIPAPDGYNLFQLICHHWVMSNMSISEGLMEVPDNQKHFVRLEDLASSKETMKSFLSFLDTPYDDTFMEVMKRPDHVYVPIDYKLTVEQDEQFRHIAQSMQNFLGYKKGEYSVKY
jgi:hypothetical protein